MPSQEQAVEKLRRDHEYMIELINRITTSCTQLGSIDDCSGCAPTPRHACHNKIEYLIRAFVEVTSKHNLTESIYMEEGVPAAHRIAHNQAHMAIAEELKTIRVVFSEDGNCVLAIEGIDRVLQSLQAHFKDFDLQLENYLLATA